MFIKFVKELRKIAIIFWNATCDNTLLEYVDVAPWLTNSLLYKKKKKILNFWIFELFMNKYRKLVTLYLPFKNWEESQMGQVGSPL